MYRYVSFAELYDLELGTHSLLKWGKHILKDSSTRFKHDVNQKYIFWFTEDPECHLWQYKWHYPVVCVDKRYALGEGVATYEQTDLVSGEYTESHHPEAYTASIPSDYTLGNLQEVLPSLEEEIEKQLEIVNAKDPYNYVFLTEDKLRIHEESDFITPVDTSYLEWLLALKRKVVSRSG
jgi:hypothetical protein